MANRIIEVRVDDKIASVVGDPLYVCGNSDYIVKFAFDAEWADHAMKTARFIKSNKEYFDVVFSGNECAMPIIDNTPHVRIGVFAGNLCTTTAAIVNAQRSILCGSGVPADPDPDVYAQMMERIDDVYELGQGVKPLTRRVDALESNVLIAPHARGDVIHIEDAASWQAVKVITHIEPMQSGSGDPSPDNIRPISRPTGVVLCRAGKNLLNPEYEQGASAHSEATTRIRNKHTIPIKKGLTYTFSASDYNQFKYVINTNNAKSEYSWETCKDCGNSEMWVSEPITFTATNNGYLAVDISKIDDTDIIPADVSNVKLQVEIGNTPTDYEPFQGITAAVELNDTIYGGEYDWSSGKLKCEWICRNLAKDAGWIWNTFADGKTYVFIYIEDKGTVLDDIVLCSHYTQAIITSVTSDIGINVTNKLNGTQARICIRPDLSIIPDLATWKTYLDAQYAAGTPVQVAYKLSTPTEIQLTPQQMPEMLKGVNNVWCDNGETELVYVAANQLYIDQTIGALKALMEGINNA